MPDFHLPDIDEWQPSPRVAVLAAKYTRIRPIAVQGYPNAHAAALVAGGRHFDVSPTGGCDNAEEASRVCYRLACALDAIVENETRGE